ncbi:MAG: hypothetical protein A2X51_06195 [Candidatus Rokubacteria bacterium GWC2_70_24]|nr:MAG: hypothetical protein A2X51_06195 [Candidatus Rokubacteria bacterium GWC2_70_24]
MHCSTAHRKSWPSPALTLPTQAATMRRTQPAPTSWSKSMSEMGPIRVRSRRPCRISSWPAAKGMSASSAAPMQIEAPSGTKRATASRMDMSLARGTRPSYPGCPRSQSPRSNAVRRRIRITLPGEAARSLARAPVLSQRLAT